MADGVDPIIDRAGRVAQRARIVLLAADAVSHTGIAERLDVGRQAVIRPPKRLD